MPADKDPRAYERHWKVRALRGLLRIYAQVWHRIYIASPCPIPANGAAILICNHSAGVDPLLLQTVSPRLITWMMAKEYYELPILRSAFERLGYIPVARGMRDSSAIKAALRTLNQGKILGIFPEGRVESTTELLPFQPGVAVMAERAKAPIYLAYIAGIQRKREIAEDLLDRHQVTISFGEPLMPSKSHPVTTEKLFDAMKMLRHQTLAHSLHR